MPRVLLVDPAAANRSMLQRRLERRGFAVDVADDGAEALAKASVAPRPDLVLSELALAGLDGFELIRRLRSQAETRLLPVIAVTAQDQDQRDRALASGAVGAYAKPVDMAQLLIAIVEAIEQAEVPAAPAAEESGRAPLLLAQDRGGAGELEARLLREGYRVERVRDGEELIARVRHDTAHLALIDLVDEDVPSVVTALRQSRGRGELPIVVFGDADDREHMVDVLTAGANDFLDKPINVELALAKVAGQLTSRRETTSVKRRPRAAQLRRITSGTRLDGRYELAELLGKGGSAMVFAATQLTTGQRVAVKVLTSVEDPMALPRFLRECEAVGSLSHPHIVRLIDSGEVEHLVLAGAGDEGGAQTCPYMVMELLDGSPLSERLEAGALYVPEAVDLALPLASALGLAHRQGIVHRDIKPANLFVAEGPGGRWHPVILDFGVAKTTEKRAGANASTTHERVLFVGTPRYLSPEQARGVKDVDGRADQYALALVLLECLAGRCPIPGGLQGIQLLVTIARGQMRGPTELVPDLPEALDRVLSHALSPEPDERYPSMAEFGRALLPFASPTGQATWRAEFG